MKRMTQEYQIRWLAKELAKLHDGGDVVDGGRFGDDFGVHGVIAEGDQRGIIQAGHDKA